MPGTIKFNIDITVHYYNSLGVEENGGFRTTNFVIKCLQDYPAMRKQVMLLKWILAAWDLNKTFTGN
jgi:DNA polymerase sigma